MAFFKNDFLVKIDEFIDIVRSVVLYWIYIGFVYPGRNSNSNP